jgi:3-oxoacyl-[acyl-carrier protein] reductase
MSMFANKIALVTGGSRGIGRETAKLLGTRQAKVAVNYVADAESAHEVVDFITAQGGDAMAVQGDVRQPRDVLRMVQEVESRFGSIHLLVNNANMSFVMKPFARMSWDEFSAKLDSELKAAFLMSQAVLPIMQTQQYGRIVYVASGLAKRPAPGMIAHGSAKAALVQFARYIAQEYGPHNITANVISPGLVDTDATSSISDERKHMLARMTPLGRVALPEDVASAIVLYLSDDSRFITGTYVPVNGGNQMD